MKERVPVFCDSEKSKNPWSLVQAPEQLLARGCQEDFYGGVIHSKSESSSIFLRKEVIQPQVPLRLPCYDLVPIREFILGACVLAVRSATWDAPPFRGLTGGVYKAQEHIHRSIADLRLLAIPASCRRVAACNPN